MLVAFNYYYYCCYYSIINNQFHFSFHNNFTKIIFVIVFTTRPLCCFFPFMLFSVVTTFSVRVFAVTVITGKTTAFVSTILVVAVMTTVVHTRVFTLTFFFSFCISCLAMFRFRRAFISVTPFAIAVLLVTVVVYLAAIPVVSPKAPSFCW